MQDYHDNVMKDTEGPYLCYWASRTVTDTRYTNYIERVKKAIAEYGEFYLLIAYKDFQGWTEAAAEKDLSFYTEYGKYMKKLALVNAPEKELMSKLLRKNLIGGEMKLFSENRLNDALAWLKS